MAAHGARRLLPMAENLGADPRDRAAGGRQGCDFHAPLRSSPPLEAVRALAARPRAAARRRSLPCTRHRRPRSSSCARRGSPTPPASTCPGLPERTAMTDVARLITARRRAADRRAFRTPEPRFRRRSRRRFVSPWLAPQGHRLVRSTVSTTSPPSCGATIVRTAHLAHGHRRQSRPVRRLALSGPGDDRALPDRPPSTASRSTAPGQQPGAEEIARRRAHYFEPYHAALARRDRAPPPSTRASSSTTATRSARAIPRLFDGELPHLQHRHQRRRDAATRALDARGRGCTARASRLRHVVERPLHAAAGSPGTTADPRPACTRSRWSSPCRGYLRRADRTRADELAAAHSDASATLARARSLPRVSQRC